MTSNGISMVVQHPHAAQHALESAAALAGHTVTIVEEIGSIDADPDLDAATADKFTPRLVHQSGVGLERLGHLEPADVAALQREGGLLVECCGQNHRLAGMPQQRERLAYQAGGEDPIEGLLQRLGRHLPLVGAVGEITIRAVEIAERRRLDNQKLQGADLGSTEGRPGRRKSSPTSCGKPPLRKPPLRKPSRHCGSRRCGSRHCGSRRCGSRRCGSRRCGSRPLPKLRN